MIKKIIISACLLLSFVSFAQQGTSSPYSFYGIGDVRFKGTVETRSMAGVAIEQDSIHINIENPASYANLKLTTFSVGGTFSSATLKTDSQSAKAQRTTLDYIAVGLPLGKKFGVGFGLIPYSSVGYQIESLSINTGGNNKRFDGSGGLNKVYLGIGYKIKPNFSIGADVQYDFGKIETTGYEFVPDVPVGTRELNTNYLSGINFNFGAMYQYKINKKLSFFSSATYTVQGKLNSENTRNISTGMLGSGLYFSVIDLGEDVKSDLDVKMPFKLALSAGVGESKKWLIGGKFSYQNAVNQSIIYNNASNVGYGKAASASIGGYYIPNYSSFSGYFNRVTYRAGIKYEKTALIINSERINDIGFTLGAGLPIPGSFSKVNLGMEFGKRGTTSAGLIQENYVNISLGFSLNDKWFERSKFN
ncbi:MULTISPECIES: autotransporter outer membrane beta-barrel domain-containing protein [unclassified Flavobacterium]|uniref:autotransporter outer membrane beta-barrel domain-containing protein n=1 Tax=unclassified Flavobacterium TaxID=196869 RepID=UPI000F0D18C3|nr:MULTISPECIES: autotransporter outer membrane beta-barrel domain-containing protein [unclassified Flavobacterium]AYN05432.1 autotransporter outer membrane beta-barrel domain-containing protein [Flavobacterium sp. 140616W15]MCD0473414.1 autotransporter outer membrane beta-barrel domain-containing protein [Flavobacterium sp. EDS]